jgi:hypothetical protein
MKANAGLPTEVSSLATLVMVMLLARLGRDSIPQHLPYLPFPEGLSEAAPWLFLGGAGLVFSQRFVRLGALLAGTALLLKVLGNMPLFSNGRLLDGLTLLLIGLYTPRWGLGPLRAQYCLVYLGAVLSKLIDVDWWNGAFVYATLDYHRPGALAAALAPWTPVMGWVTMATEAAIGVGLAVPGWRTAAVVLTAVFHTGLLVVLREDFATFFYTVSLSAGLLFLEWPAVRAVQVPGAGFAFLAQSSVFASLREAPVEQGRWAVQFPRYRYDGLAALGLLLLANLPVLALLVGAVALGSRRGYVTVREVVLVGCVGLALGVWRWRTEEAGA